MKQICSRCGEEREIKRGEHLCSECKSELYYLVGERATRNINRVSGFKRVNEI